MLVIKCCAVVEKPAFSHLSVKSHPMTVVIGFADIETFKLISCGFDVKLKTFDAFANLEAVFSFGDSG